MILAFSHCPALLLTSALFGRTWNARQLASTWASYLALRSPHLKYTKRPPKAPFQAHQLSSPPPCVLQIPKDDIGQRIHHPCYLLPVELLPPSPRNPHKDQWSDRQLRFPLKSIPRSVQMSHPSFTGVYHPRTDISLKAAAMLVAKLPDPSFPMPLVPTLMPPTPITNASPDHASLIPSWNRGAVLRDPARRFIDYNRYQAALFVHQRLPLWSGNTPCSSTYRELLACEDSFLTSFVTPLSKPLHKWLELLHPSSPRPTSSLLLKTLSKNLTQLPRPDSNAQFQLQFFCNGLMTRSRATHLGRATSTACAFCGHSNDRLRSHLFNDCPFVLQAKKSSAAALGTSWSLPLLPLDHAMLTAGDPAHDQDIRRRFILSCNQGVWSSYQDLLWIRNQDEKPPLPQAITEAICNSFSKLRPTRKRKNPSSASHVSRRKHGWNPPVQPSAEQQTSFASLENPKSLPTDPHPATHLSNSIITNTTSD